MKKFRIILLNITIIVAVVVSIIFYVLYQQQNKEQSARESFRMTTEMMEDVASSYFVSSQARCNSWTNYINAEDLTLEEAVGYVRQAKTNDKISGHIVYLDTMEGLSTNPSSENASDYTVSYENTDIIDLDEMEQDTEVHVTQCYNDPMSGEKVVAFYNKISLMEEGGTRSAVLLRVVPVSVLNEQWAFPASYTGAQSILMDVDGNYVVVPDSMEGSNFFDIVSSSIKNQNAKELEDEMRTSSDGEIYAYDSEGTKQYIVYKHVQTNPDWLMIGFIAESALEANSIDWTIPLIIIIALALALLIDITYFRENIRQRTRSQETLREQLDVIEVLSREYQTLWVINGVTRECRLYRGEGSRGNDGNSLVTQRYEDVLEKYIHVFVAPEEQDEVRKTVFGKDFFKNIPNTGIYSLNYTKTINDESSYFQMCFAKSFDLNGEMRIVLGLRDIDEMVRKEARQNELLRDALAQAESANKAKSTFLSSMSHDIRTPLNGVIGMTAIAATHLEDKNRVADCLQKITVASKHLLGLINEVLDMSKIESGKIELNEEEFNLSDLVENLLQMIKPEIEKHHHEIAVNIWNVEHEKVIGDSLRIQQVFMNLMSNAVKYTPDGGKIKLSISEKATNQKKIGLYEIVFEDNGIGMEQEFVDRIFEPFARAKDQRVSSVQGTGLGMTIARNIVRMMGGDVKVESSPGEGTKITVVFFMELQDEEKRNYDQFIDLPILVADDDEVSCESTCNILDEIGMKSEWVLSGGEAVLCVENRHASGDDFFAIILDWKMPEMDGIETARRIRASVGEEVPIIILSAYDWEEIEQEARKAGVNAFISKPLFKSRMINLFQTLVGDSPLEEKAAPLIEFGKINLTGKRLLLVEDNELNAEIATEILEMTGIEVEHAEDGREAVDRIVEVRDGYYDLVLMDVQMPVMNGYEATRAIRSLDRAYAKTLPIVAMTANAFAEDVHAAKSAGMNAHISKPLDLDVLARILYKWVA